ncbi:ABC transporter substrate-binding protein [Caballeronia sp. LZ034LL]|uniref:ABC transporter substrate-binding protein n=1 Tax=Caballeronia sp. LZ034LL TaxID=3038567 RepID=UPI002864ED1A|nr:ABC transporter substrate-binding protein [Caballeronia sp. LZ034LL]MDR5836052.1 ABC transporter substrate-binding protein [Caballeronia sp. LZ034LL]
MIRRFRRSRALCLAVGATLAALASYNTQAATTLTYGYIAPVAYYWDVFAAKALSYDAQEGIDIRPMRIDSASQSVQTLLAGAVDVLSTPAELAIAAREKGADVTMIGAETARASFALIARPEITRIEDLRGKTIGVTQINEAVSTMVALLLEQHGLKRGDYQLLALGGGPTRYAALSRGAIAATALSQPQDFRAVKEGLTHLGYTFEAFDGVYIVFATRAHWAQEHRTDVTAFLRATVRAGRWLRDQAHRAQAIAILRDAIGIDEADAARTYDLYFGPTAVMARDGTLPDADVQRYLTLRGSRDAPAHYVERSYLQQALKASGGAP